jgi:hypothetical protein
MIDSFDLLDEWQKGVDCIAAKENLRKHKSMMDAESTND